MKHEFCVGDRVMLTTDTSGPKLGAYGTIVHYYADEDIGVAWDNKFRGGHNCCEHCENGYGWYVPAEWLTLADEDSQTEYTPATSEELFSFLGV